MPPSGSTNGYHFTSYFRFLGRPAHTLRQAQGRAGVVLLSRTLLVEELLFAGGAESVAAEGAV